MLETIKNALSLLDGIARRWLGVLFLMTLIGALIEALGISLIFPLLKLITDPTAIQTNQYLNWVYSTLQLSSSKSFVILCTVTFFGLFLVKTIFMVGFYFAQYTFAFSGIVRLSNQLFSRYLHAPYLSLIDQNSTVLIRNIRESTHDVYSTFIISLINLAVEFFLIISVTIIVFAIEPKATLLAGVVVCGLIFSFYRILGPAFERWGYERLSLSQRALQSLQQSLGSIKETRILGRTGYFLSAFSQIQDREMINRRNHQLVSQLPRLLNETVLLGGMCTVIIVVFLSNTSVSDVIASLGLFAAAALRLSPSVNRITASLQNLRGSKPAVKMTFDEFQRLSINVNSEINRQPRATIRVKSIQLENISFSYPGTRAPAIHEISTNIRGGESIGLVGPSGAGKTTLADIILGLLPPTNGTLLLNGKLLSDLTDQYCSVSYVPQSIYIIDDTLRKNIAFGINEEEIDDTKVNSALKLAHLTDLVKSFPDGINTELKEQGARLSGGQRQRVGIARALYNDPEVLVLDEASSALDNETEREITNALNSLKGQKTVIVIAHRLSTVRSCDKLLYLSAGRLVDEGTFEQLVKRNEKFRRLTEISDTIASLPE